MESNALFKLAILPLAQGNSWNSRCFGVVSAGRAPLDEELQGRESEMVSLYSHQSKPEKVQLWYPSQNGLKVKQRS